MSLHGKIINVIANEYDRIVHFQVENEIIVFNYLDSETYYEEQTTLQNFINKSINVSLILTDSSFTANKTSEGQFYQPISGKPHAIINGKVEAVDGDEAVVFNEKLGSVEVELLSSTILEVGQMVDLEGELSSEDDNLASILII